MRNYRSLIAKHFGSCLAFTVSLLTLPAAFGKRPYEGIDPMRDTGGPGDGSFLVFLGLLAAIMYLFYLVFPEDHKWVGGLWVAPLFAALLTHLFV